MNWKPSSIRLSSGLATGVARQRAHRRRRRRRDDPERSLLRAVRSAVLPTMALPCTLASLGASLTGEGLPLALSAALMLLAVIANVSFWRTVIVLWRRLPRRGDDDGGWGRGPGADPPSGPDSGPGVGFDWPSFEQQFWAYVRERELVAA